MKVFTDACHADNILTIAIVGLALGAWSGAAQAEEFVSQYTTIEWRSLKGAAKPFAIIQRWSVSDYDERTEERKSRQVLIVTRLAARPGMPRRPCRRAGEQGRECDGARKAADELARKFKCGTDEVHHMDAPDTAAEPAKE